jgi:hypothetical protein
MDDAGWTPFGDGIWLASEPVRIVGTRLTATMALLRLGDGELLAYSPVPLTPARRAALPALGRVAHVYAPSLYHDRWLGEWATAFPTARVHAPAGLAKRYPQLRVDRQLRQLRQLGSAPEPAFAGVLDERHIDGCRLDETVLLHRPTGTLVVADLVHNVGRPTHGWTRAYTGLMGFYDRVALSRMLRWLAFSDRAAARRSLDAVLALPFDRLVVGHGAPLASGGRAALAAAYAWLPPA